MKRNHTATAGKPSRFLFARGFTLSELILAAAILAFALSGLLSLYCKVLVLNKGGVNQFTAMNHAQIVIEEIRNTTFSSIATSIQGGTWDWATNTIAAKGLTPLIGESIDTSYTGTNLLDISVTVSWQDLGQRARSLTVSTKMASK